MSRTTTTHADTGHTHFRPTYLSSDDLDRVIEALTGERVNSPDLGARRAARAGHRRR